MKASQKVGEETPMSEMARAEMIDPAVAPDRRQNAERHADEEGEEEA